MTCMNLSFPISVSAGLKKSYLKIVHFCGKKKRNYSPLQIYESIRSISAQLFLLGGEHTHPQGVFRPLFCHIYALFEKGALAGVNGEGTQNMMHF